MLARVTVQGAQKAAKNADISAETRDLERAMARLFQGARSLMQRVDDISLAQRSAMAILKERGEIRLSTIAEMVRMDMSVASRQIAQLEEAGLVTRRRDPDDGRAMLVSITPQGTTSLRDINRRHEKELSTVLEGWTNDEIQTLISSIVRLADSLMNKAENANE